jgi:hypothetical protein
MNKPKPEILSAVVGMLAKDCATHEHRGCEDCNEGNKFDCWGKLAREIVAFYEQKVAEAKKDALDKAQDKFKRVSCSFAMAGQIDIEKKIDYIFQSIRQELTGGK